MDNSKNATYAYNVKVYDYPTGKQVRVYKNALLSGYEKEENLVENKRELSEEELKEKSEKCLTSSINRTVQNLYCITRANLWNWFITFTFDPKMVDNTDYDLVTKLVSQWFKNVKKRKCPNMKYVLVPELHKDGKKWHIHGLLADCPELDFVDSGIVQNGHIVYNISNWIYGFSTATQVKDSGRVSSYITKYITKEMCVCTSGRKRYWASRNCVKAKDVCSTALLTGQDLQDFLDSIGDDIVWCKTQRNDASGQVIKYLEIGR